jgi:Holliday junction resolvase RusA-like endonuclease
VSNQPLLPIVLSIPYPPSINSYFATVKRGGKMRRTVTQRGRDFREQVRWCCISQVTGRAGRLPIDFPVSVAIHLMPPDRRKRDNDNIQKPLLDALQKSGIVSDDHLVNPLATWMYAPDGRDGACIVVLDDQPAMHSWDEVTAGLGM